MLDEETLNAYADGELDDDECARVATALASDADARMRLAAIRRVSLLGRAAVEGIARDGVPDRLRERVWPLEPAPARAGLGPGWTAAAWSTALSLALGLGIGAWLMRPGEAPLPALAVEPVVWHQQAAWHHGLAAERQARLQPLSLDLEHRQAAPLQGALIERLGRPVVVPDLSGFGLDLVGARLLVERLQPLAQVFYQDPAGNLISLLVALDTGPDAPPRFQRVEQTPVLSWREGGTAYVLVGETGRERLQGLAIAVSEQTRR
jgi:anti-sigma factor RsiW